MASIVRPSAAGSRSHYCPTGDPVLLRVHLRLWRRYFPLRVRSNRIVELSGGVVAGTGRPVLSPWECVRVSVVTRSM
jgi:hypothetical protein